MLFENHIHHQLDLIQSLFIENLIVLLFGLYHVESGERISALVAASDQDSSLGCAADSTALENVWIKFLDVDRVLW